jgi:hypothetical protein
MIPHMQDFMMTEMFNYDKVSTPVRQRKTGVIH